MPSRKRSRVKRKAKAREVRNMPKPWFFVPPIAPGFHGREEILKAIDDAFVTSKEGSIAGRVSLVSNLSGIGTSAIAREYCHRYKGRFDLTMWLDASTLQTMETDVDGILKGLKLEAKPNASPFEKEGILKTWVNWTTNKWLLVFDNAENIPLLHKILRHIPMGCVLVTSKSNESCYTWGYSRTLLTRRCRIGELEVLESAGLLARNAPSAKSAKAALEAARDLCQIIGGHPVLLLTTADYIQRHNMTFEACLDQFKKKEQTIDFSQALFEQNKFAGDSSIMDIFRPEFDELRDKHGQASVGFHIMGVLTMLSTVKVDTKVFDGLAHGCDEDDSSLKSNDGSEEDKLRYLAWQNYLINPQPDERYPDIGPPHDSGTFHLSTCWLKYLQYFSTAKNVKVIHSAENFWMQPLILTLFERYITAQERQAVFATTVNVLQASWRELEGTRDLKNPTAEYAPLLTYIIALNERVRRPDKSMPAFRCDVEYANLLISVAWHLLYATDLHSLQLIMQGCRVVVARLSSEEERKEINAQIQHLHDLVGF